MTSTPMEMYLPPPTMNSSRKAAGQRKPKPLVLASASPDRMPRPIERLNSMYAQLLEKMSNLPEDMDPTQFAMANESLLIDDAKGLKDAITDLRTAVSEAKEDLRQAQEQLPQDFERRKKQLLRQAEKLKSKKKLARDYHAELFSDNQRLQNEAKSKQNEKLKLEAEVKTEENDIAALKAEVTKFCSDIDKKLTRARPGGRALK